MNRIATATAAAGRVLAAAAEGRPVLVPGELRGQRLALCKVCPHKAGAVCGACGCIVAVKTELATERCPLGRW